MMGRWMKWRGYKTPSVPLRSKYPLWQPRSVICRRIFRSLVRSTGWMRWRLDTLKPGYSNWRVKLIGSKIKSIHLHPPQGRKYSRREACQWETRFLQVRKQKTRVSSDWTKYLGPEWGILLKRSMCTLLQSAVLQFIFGLISIEFPLIFVFNKMNNAENGSLSRAFEFFWFLLLCNL